MTDSFRNAPDTLKGLADTVAGIGAGFLRYREFISRKAARQIMEDIGLVSPDEDLTTDKDLTTMEDIMGTGIGNGITLSMRGETDQATIDQRLSELSEQIPSGTNSQLRTTLIELTSRMIDQGIEIHMNEIVPGSDRVTEWKAEFDQLQAIDPNHQHWGD